MARIREALKIAAPHPVADALPAGSPQQRLPHQSRDREGAGKTSTPLDLQQWLPRVGQTPDEQIELFRQNARHLAAEFHICASLDAAILAIQSLAANEGWKKIAFHHGELAGAAARSLALPAIETRDGYALDELESCDAGLTECECLVAQTGSVLISSIGSGGRALSVLPPHHIVLARRSQMVPDLTAAIESVRAKYNGQFPGFLSFITGPSRTGDIERILVLGAHGPKKLTILVI